MPLQFQVFFLIIVQITCHAQHSGIWPEEQSDSADPAIFNRIRIREVGIHINRMGS